jgi:hypoxia up-regulated 1
MAPPGRRKLSLNSLLPLLLLLFLATTAHAASAVLGIDLGTEYIKSAIAKPGSPIEIVLSKDSKRKEAATLAFKPSKSQKNDDEAFPDRFYGGDASALSARFPGDVYPNLKSLLGLAFSADAVSTYASRYPGLELQSVSRDGSSDKKAGTVGFKSQSFGEKRNEVFMVEELLAMELKNIRSNAEAMVAKGVSVGDVVVTFPAFYTADEKRAIELAVDLAGLRLLGLVSDGVAVGLNYATHRTFDSVTDGGKPEYNVIYDMGAGSTTATVVKFQGRTVKNAAKRNTTFQEVIALGTGSDASLGGDSFNDVIVEDIISEFVKSPKVQNFGVSAEQVRSSGKAMARIWKDAEKIRQGLSANALSSASFEGLYDDDITFKYSLTREKFEALTESHASRVGLPIHAALDAAGMTLEEINSVILHGGAVRTPFVQKELEKVTGGTAKLMTNVNADEAAAMGAAFKAAVLSPVFRVKDIRDTDISGSAYTLTWTADKKDKSQKLFTPLSQVGIEKQVPLKTLEDVTLSFSQSVDESDVPVLSVDASNLTRSVTELKDQHGCAPSNISTVFIVRLSTTNGLPEIASGSVSCEANNTKTGSVIDNVKGLFGFGAKKDGDQKVLEDEDVLPDTTEEQTPLPVSDPTSSGTTVSATSSITESPSSSSSKGAKASKPTPSIVTVPLALRTTALGLNAPPVSTLQQVRKRLNQFDTSDRNAILKDEALNSLEAFAYRAKDYLENESFIASSSASARKELQNLASSTSDWLYGEGQNAKLQDVRDKLKALHNLVDPVLKRQDEAAKRPDAVKALQEGLQSLQGMIGMVEGNIKKAAEDAASKASEVATSVTSMVETPISSIAVGDDLDEDPYSSDGPEKEKIDSLPPYKPYEYTNEDLTPLTAKYDEVKKWLDEKLGLQEKLGPSDDPVFLSSELETKGQELQRLVSETIMKTIRMQDIPKKGKSGGSKKSSKPRTKKGKTSSSSASDTGPTATSSSEAGPSKTSTTSSKAKASKKAKDEL